MNRFIKRARFALLLAILPTMLFACKAHTDIRKNFMNNIRYGQYVAAEKVLIEIGGKEKLDLLVDYMDRGMVLHRMGKYKESNEWLTKAENLIEELFTQKVSEQLKAIAWNDSSISYQGEEFERIMVNMIMAMNYLMLNDMQGSMVEIRKVNHKLGLYADKLEKNGVKKFTYKVDAFANYLAALIQEASNATNDAFISYCDAYKGYELFTKDYNVSCPAQLKLDLLRSAKKSGLLEKYNEWKAKFGALDEITEEMTKDKGELVVNVGVGVIAYKVSKKWMHNDGTGDMIAVTYPEFTSSVFDSHHYIVKAAGIQGHSQEVHNLSKIAIKNLNDRNDEVKGAAIARAVAMYVVKKAGKAAAKSDNMRVSLIGTAVNIAANVRDILEVADTRSWVSLPDNYQMTRLWLPPGPQKVELQVFGRSGAPLYTLIFNVDITKDGKTFLFANAPDHMPDVAPGAVGAAKVGAQKM